MPQGQEPSIEGRESQPEISVVLQLATEADHEFARMAYLVSYRDVMTKQFGSWDEEEQSKYFEIVWSDGDNQIINVEGKPSGFLQVEELPDKTWVHEVVLLPEVQGKGIGSRLLRTIQETAKQRQVPVRLNVLHANPAIELYKRLGFEAVGEAETYTEMEWKPTQGSANSNFFQLSS